MGLRRFAAVLIAVAVLAAGVSVAFLVPAPPAGAVNAPAPGTIDTVAGGVGGPSATGVALGPTAVAWLSPTVAVVADAPNHLVRRVDLAAGTTSVIAGYNSGTPASAPYTSGTSVAVPATSVGLTWPSAVAVDGAGNVYVAELQGRVSKIDAAGMLVPVAGTGSQSSYAPENVPALQSPLNQPAGLAVAANGTVFISEAGGHRIRKVDPAGFITTLAGAGVDGYGGDGATATSALFSSPTGLAVDGTGAVYVADTGNHRIRKVAGGTVVTVAGTGVAGSGGDGALAVAASLRSPRGVALDATGALLVADTGNQKVRRISSGTITSVAGSGATGFGGDGGAATAATFSGPVAIAARGTGEVLVADVANNRVRRFTVGGSIATVVGNGAQQHAGDGGPASLAMLGAPVGVAADAHGNVFVADTANHRIRRVDAAGTITTVVGDGVAGFSGDGGAAATARVSGPTGLALQGDDLLIADTGNNRIRKVSGGTISTIAGSGPSASTGDGGPATAASLAGPRAVAASGADVVIADTGGNRVRKVSGGTITTIAGTGALGYGGSGGPATLADLAAPTAVAVDAGGTVFVGEAQLPLLRKITTDGVLRVAAGSFSYGGGQTDRPTPADQAYLYGVVGLAIEPSGGLLISDFTGVRRLLAGMVSTVAGPGNARYSMTSFGGDGWLATQARLASPTGLAVDGDGTVFVADTGNNRVRAFVPAGADGFGFHPLTPTRILDSRDGTGGQSTPWPACTSRSVDVAGVAGVPKGATAVVLNLTVTGGTAASFLSVAPAGSGNGTSSGTVVGSPITTIPGGTGTSGTIPAYCSGPPSNTSSVNFVAGQTVANQIVARVGEQGRVIVYNSAGSVNVIADIVGWYDSGTEGGDRYTPLPPARIVDSRTGTGTPATPWAAGSTRDVQVAGAGGVPVGATAVVANVTVTQPTAAGFLTLWPAGEARPNASSINFAPGQTVANLAVVKLGAGGKLSVFSPSGTVHVIVDVVGAFSANPAADAFIPIEPSRFYDSRTTNYNGGTPWQAGESRSIVVGGGQPNGQVYPPGYTLPPPLVPADATGVVVNVTVTQTSADGFLTLWPTGQARPNASTLNFLAGQTVANHAMVKLGTGGAISVFNPSGTAHVIIDVVGYYR